MIDPVYRCHLCMARVEWVYTVKGRRVPLDLAENPAGNIVVEPNGTMHIVREGGNRTLHLDTCPNRQGRRPS